MRTIDRIRKVGWRQIFSINKILKSLVLSDILLISAFGLMSPVFAVYVSDQIIGGSLIVVGIAESIYLLTKSLLQIPIGVIIDNTEGEKIDFWLAISGSLLMSISAFLYTATTLPIHIYLIQFLMGIGAAMAFPSWMGLFTRNMEEGKESLVWSLHSTSSEIGSAIAAFLGGVISDKLGFKDLFVFVGLISLLGTFLIVFIYKEIDKL